MRKWILYTMVGLLTGILASCTSLIEDEPYVSSDDAKVMFTLSMGDIAGARTARDASYVLGDKYENTIDVTNTKVVFYDERNSLWGKVNDLTFQPTAEENVYHIIGILELSQGASLTNIGKLKVVVLTNCGNRFDNQYSSLAGLSYGYPLGNQNYIPMWGVKSFENISFAPGTRTDLGTINLLRALAKVHIKSDTNVLNGVTLDGCPAIGLCVPEASNLDNNGYAVSPTLPVSLGIAPTVNFEKSEAGGFIAYLPEKLNSDANGLVMKVALDDKVYDLPFKDFTKGGTWMNVLRNTYYVYTVSVKEQALDVQLAYKVEDWTKAPDIEIGFN